MTSYTQDVHCSKCNRYVYSLPLYPTKKDYEEAEGALCDMCAPPPYDFSIIDD